MTFNLTHKLSKYYKQISYIGIENQSYDPYYDHKKLSNQNMFHFLMNLMILLPISVLFISNKSLISYSLLLIPLSIILFYLHSHHFKIARILSVQLQVILVFVGSVIYGPEADLISFYFPILMKVFFLYKMNEKKEIYVHGSIILLFYVGYYLSQDYLSPYAIYASQAKTIFWVTTPFKFINLVSIIYIAFNRNNESETKLNTQKAYLQSIIDNLPLDIVILDDKFRYRFINKNAEQDHETRQWMIGKNDIQYAKHKQKKLQAHEDNYLLYNRAKATMQAQISEIKVETDSQKMVQMQVVTPLLDHDKADQHYYIITRMDISQLKQSEEMIKKYSLSLEQKNEELKQFAYIASHDLKSPLRNIATMLQLLEKRSKENLDEKSLGLITTSIHAAEYLYRLVSDILLYSTSEITEHEREKVNMNAIVEKVSENLQNVIISREAEIKVEHTLPVILAHETLMTNLFQNLIENGIKYNENPHPVVSISCIERQEDYLFSISDNGIGISEKYKEQIFVLFKRLHTQSQYEGTGIGLSICKKIVEKYQGKIWIESEEGKGTSFYFSIAK